MNEAILEPILREFRLKRVLKLIKPTDVVLDVGCGWNAKLVSTLSPRLNTIVGIDKKVREDLTLPPNASVTRSEFGVPWTVPQNHFSLATMLAVLEHLSEDDSILVLGNIHKALKPDGKILLTVPTPRAKPVLEFLAFKLQIVSREEIEDHKIYYDKSLLTHRLSSCGFKVLDYRTFQLGMNSFCVAEKNK